MKARLISAACMIAVGLPCVLMGGVLMQIFLTAIMVITSYELAHIKNGKLNIPVFLIIFIFNFLFFKTNIKYGLEPFLLIALFFLGVYDETINAGDIAIYFTMANITAIGFNCAYLCYSFHQYLLLYIAIASLVCDAAAYFVGRKFGKHKMCPRISPKKSWEGAIGGVIVGFIVSFIVAYIFDFFGFGFTKILVCSIVLPVISEYGDLAFSLVKRQYNAKDYGNIIPGHGGLLDRFDSVLFCLLFMIFVLSF